MESLRKQAEQDRTYLVSLRRDFHRHPELALREYRTAERIEAELDKISVEHRRVGETGMPGVLRGSDPEGAAVALRADIDALPIQELNESEYRSKRDGVMHACGHDAHTSCLIGAARALAKNCLSDVL